MCMGVNLKGQAYEHYFECCSYSPCCQVGLGGRGLGIEKGNEEQTVDEEGAYEVDLV